MGRGASLHSPVLLQLVEEVDHVAERLLVRLCDAALHHVHRYLLHCNCLAMHEEAAARRVERGPPAHGRGDVDEATVLAHVEDRLPVAVAHLPHLQESSPRRIDRKEQLVLPLRLLHRSSPYLWRERRLKECHLRLSISLPHPHEHRRKGSEVDQHHTAQSVRHGGQAACAVDHHPKGLPGGVLEAVEGVQASARRDLRRGLLGRRGGGGGVVVAAPPALGVGENAALQLRGHVRCKLHERAVVARAAVHREEGLLADGEEE
mmetsp:Transcript_16630/g.64937  ORF Transcript_16630/g.64937 Transcript_16630/m.64937 type:complete len:262 (-) Transcript_16630:481-1266(-)